LRSPQRDISHIHALLFPLSGRMQKYTRNMLQRISAEHCVTCARAKPRGRIYDTPQHRHRLIERAELLLNERVEEITHEHSQRVSI